MRVALISVVSLVAACGGGGVSISTNQDNFCSEIAEVVCHNMYQCCTESEIEDRLSVSDPRTEAQCREDYERICDRTAPDLRDSLKAGRVTFDANRLNACLDAVLAPDDVCSEIVTGEAPWKEPCKDAPWVGTVQTGGSCFFNFDCAGAPDSYCGPDQKCKAKPTAGFPCGTGCASQYYCASNGTCAAKLAVNAPCESDYQCDKDLYCDQSATPEPICTMKGAGGSSCKSDYACLSGDCVPGQCMGTTQQCFEDSNCSSRCADDGSFCTTAANCALGNCSVTGTSCNGTTSNCTGGSDVCVFPVQCLPGDCVGDPVCTASTLTADYCTSIGNIPSP
jgi:hypothetical protein